MLLVDIVQQLNRWFGNQDGRIVWKDKVFLLRGQDVKIVARASLPPTLSVKSASENHGPLSSSPGSSKAVSKHDR